MRMRNGALLVFLITVLACGPLLAQAKRVTAPTDTRLDEIVVTAKRRFDLVADAKIKEEVEEALHSDPLFYDAHVTVTTKNGVVTLEGIVFDDWDLRQAMRISKRVAGVKRVVNDLEIKLGGE
jgi:osmotically-inducible protein OsmY